MPDPFTIRIFMPDGEPDGVRIIDRMNWTGKGIVFPRTKWQHIRDRSEFSGPGVYILSGYDETSQDEDKPKIYIGQGEETRKRINSHDGEKDFWDTGFVFVSQTNALNRAHITWLEHKLIETALKAERCNLDNGQTPNEPSMAEAEKADTEGFLNEILQILPLVDLHVFKYVHHEATHASTTETETIAENDTEDIVVVVPARISDDESKEEYERVFFGNDGSEPGWHAIRINSNRIPYIRYLALYKGVPDQMITHYAPVKEIVPYGNTGKYRLVFSEAPRKLEKSIKYGDAPKGAMQGTRYTTLSVLKNAHTVSDLGTINEIITQSSAGDIQS